jgi:arsenate reductase-like glutaredoxin family protein
VQALIDRDSRRFAELGLRAALYGDERWLTLLVDEPLLLRQPLVRIGPWVGIGVDEAAWKEALLKAAG